jgi:1,4-dihydroxy-2-naphthoyl-CoA hydrolase
MAASGLGLGTGLLAEHVVTQLAPPLRVDELGGERSQFGQRLARELAYAGRRKVEHLADLLVAAVLAQNDLDDRPLVRSQLVKRGHRTMKGTFIFVADAPSYAIPMAETLDGILGFEVVDMESDRASARFEVQNRHRQPWGIVHGGVYAALAEGLCSSATYMQVKADGKIAVGASNFTSFLRPVSGGVVTAAARALHSGRTSWVWECEFTNEDGKRCAVSRVTLAVIDPQRP